jgi:hypothetical protein
VAEKVSSTSLASVLELVVEVVAWFGIARREGSDLTVDLTIRLSTSGLKV